MRIPTLLARLALAEVKSDADTLAITEFLQPSVIPFGILPGGGRRLVRSGCFGLRLWLLRTWFGKLWPALWLLGTGVLHWFWPWGQ